MNAFLAFLVPIGVGALLSAWLYGAPGRRQRSVAPDVRRRTVFALAALVALLAITMFFTRTHWFRVIVITGLRLQVAGQVFLGLILLLVSVLYAAVPPQRDL